MPKGHWPLLKPVSRSMFLSLRALPAEVRDTMALGYLFCRAADAIADTPKLTPAQRLELLEHFWAAWDTPQGMVAFAALEPAMRAAPPAQSELLRRLPELFMAHETLPGDERSLIRNVVAGVLEGMRTELARFDGQGLKAFERPEELERYCYAVGGRPGEFWTRLCLLRLPGLGGTDAAAFVADGVSLGIGLQITNILRDLPEDLRDGRCYLPSSDLSQASLEPKDLVAGGALEKLRPVLLRWIDWGVSHLDAGARYVRSLPPKQLRLRAAAAWPLLLSLKTLGRVRKADDLLSAGRRQKVPRREVAWMLAVSPVTLASDAAFDKTFAAARASAAGSR